MARSQNKWVVASTPFRGQAIHHGVNRNLNHVIIIPCAAALGKHPIPCLVTSQDLKSLRMDVQKRIIEFERHFVMQENQKACVNDKTFVEYIKLAFLPDVTTVRSERGIEQEKATPFMVIVPVTWPVM
jgi:hypothetical protein